MDPIHQFPDQHIFQLREDWRRRDRISRTPLFMLIALA